MRLKTTLPCVVIAGMAILNESTSMKNCKDLVDSGSRGIGQGDFDYNARERYDTVASAAISSLKRLESEEGELCGTDCQLFSTA